MSTVNTSSVEAMLSLVTERRDFYICIYFSMFCNRFYPQDIMKCHSKYNDCWQMIIIDKDMLQRKGFSAELTVSSGTRNLPEQFQKAGKHFCY